MTDFSLFACLDRC